MIVTAWNNGRHHASGAGYGLKVAIADRDRYFDPEVASVVLELKGWGASGLPGPSFTAPGHDSDLCEAAHDHRLPRRSAEGKPMVVLGAQHHAVVAQRPDRGGDVLRTEIPDLRAVAKHGDQRGPVPMHDRMDSGSICHNFGRWRALAPG